MKIDGEIRMYVKVKHNKIRNTGLLFECLLRQITSDVLDNEKHSVAVNIVKQRFNENTELGKELALYNILMNKKFNSDKKANYFIQQVIKEQHKLNNSILKREKYNLIKEIKNNYNLQHFLSSKVRNYRVYGSIFKLFEFYNNISPEDKTESYFNIVEHITTKKHTVELHETAKIAASNDTDLRIITYRILLEKFNQKYSHLNKSQKSLLKAYINNVTNTNSLKEYIDKEIPNVQKQLSKHISKIDEKIVKIKLKEAINSITDFCINSNKSNTVKDSSVVQMMRYYELIKELKKSG